VTARLREAFPSHITYRMIRFVVADLQCAAHRVRSVDALPPD
jgi:hypothetical protein